MSGLNKKIKITHFLNSKVRGGVENHVLLLLKYIDRERFEPVVVCPAALAKLIGGELQAMQVGVFELEVITPFDLRDMLRFVSFLRREKIDIVHAHLFNASRASHFLAKVAGVPITIETNHVREAWRKGRLKTWYAIDRFFARFTDCIIAVSKANAEYLFNVKGIARSKVRVVQNGIETKALHRENNSVSSIRAALGVSMNAPLITVVARLESQKGHCYLLEAVAEILSAHPEAIFLLAGDGVLAPELKAQAKRLGIENNIIFAGFRSDVHDLLRASTVFLLPSLWEGLPLVAIEASAVGLPIIATAVDGTPEVVKDGDTGLLIEPRSSGAIATAVIELLDDPERARKMGRRGASFVRAHFDVSRQVEETERIYKELAAGKEIGERAI
jgi:glycosyltransferase involved in cell wall biosynthesis